jgi:hypothetical protein
MLILGIAFERHQFGRILGFFGVHFVVILQLCWCCCKTAKMKHLLSENLVFRGAGPSFAHHFLKLFEVFLCNTYQSYLVFAPNVFFPSFSSSKLNGMTKTFHTPLETYDSTRAATQRQQDGAARVQMPAKPS